MVRGTGYYLRLLVYRQSATAPVLVFLGILAAIYASPAGPPVAAGLVPALALMPLTAWITRVVATAESEPFAEVSLVALGGPGGRQRAQAAAVLVVACALGGVSLLWAVLANNPGQYSAGSAVAIVGMSLAEAVAGLGVGTLLGPPVRPGTTVLSVTGLVVVSLIVPWLPPLNPLLRVGERTPAAAPGVLAAAMAQAAGVGLVALLAGAVVRSDLVRRPATFGRATVRGRERP